MKMNAIGPSGIEGEIGRWIIIATGIMLLFFGVILYYSAIRFFGMIVGGYFGLIIVMSLLKGGTYSETFTVLFIAIGIIVGAILGALLAIVFHHIVTFAAGAILSLILYKMFAEGLVTPDALKNLTIDKFLDLIKPKASIETAAMIIGGLIYLASAHLLIVIIMALVGSYLIAWGFNIYALFPILAPLGGIFQWSVTRGRRVVVIKRRRVV